MSNLLCYVSNNDELAMEFWGVNNKKLTIYPHSNYCLKIWGSNIHIEMEDFSFQDAELVKLAFEWLNE